MNDKGNAATPIPEWFDHVRRDDYQLTPQSPIWADAVRYPEPTELYFDMHAGIEIGIVISGAAERIFVDDAGLNVIRPGHLWFISMWEPHGGRILTPGTEVVVMIFLPEFIGSEELGGLSWLSLFAVPHMRRPWLGDEFEDKVYTLGLELQKEIQKKELGWQAVVKSHLLYILAMLRRMWPLRPTRMTPEEIYRASVLGRILPAMELLHHTTDHHLTLAQAGQVCGMSASRFRTVFQDAMGLSFTQFSLHVRLGKAALLLRSTDNSIDQVAALSGFVDGSHFHRHFVKRYGVTPAKYRQKLMS